MGASQSATNNAGLASSSRRGKKQVVASPESIQSAMSTDDPCKSASSVERARKRARKDSGSMDLSSGKEQKDFIEGSKPPLPPPPPVCEVFVSGASCRLPESDNLEEFWHNLIEGRDMVTEDDRRWPPGLHNLPRRNGKLKDLSKFDAEFFRINPAQAHAMDPQLRLLFEVAYEAIVDAGYNPFDLKGTQTGVFVGNMFMEALEASSNDTKGGHVGYGLTGACDSMLSNYLSFFFDFKGPSLTVNTGCSASLAAFDLAVKSLLCGQCEFAIAAGTNILLKPGTALHMLRLGMLARDGSCKAFDASADGYVRSEGIVAVFLTTKENARHAYAKVLNSMSSCDGHKSEGIAYPSSESQRDLIWGVHYEIGLDPSEMFYVEAHGTGTQAGDFEECKALDEAIACSKCRMTSGESTQLQDDEQVRSKCDDRNDSSLLVGSVKSKMGHCEPASGLAGIVKVLLSYRHGIIPPNLHYLSPNPRISSLVEGRLSVVTTPTPLPPNVRIGINSFGFGGAITHVILKGCETVKTRMSRKADIVSKVHIPEVVMDMVTMVLPLTSRTEQGLQQLMDFVATYRMDKEALTLLSRSFGHAPVDTHPHRGYVLWNKKELITASAILPPQTTTSKQQVWFIFDGMGSQWSGIGKDLLKYDIFSDTVRRCYEALPPDVNNLIIDSQSEMAESSNLVVDEIAAVCAVSIGLVELLKAVGIKPDGLIGHSLGELVLCYADGALSLEQCMQMAYWRIKCVIDADIPDGAMATVGLPWDEVKVRCPGNVWPVCSNSLQNVTVSGEASAVEKFVAELSKEKIFTKMVKSSGLPYHSPLMQPAVNEKTFGILKGIVNNPKPKSKKWVVTALPRDEDPESVVCSAEFHIRSLVTPVFFYEALQKIPPGSVVIEVGAHALLQAILKRSLQGSSYTIVPLQDWKEKDQSVVFMRALGTCHNAGVSVNPLAVVKSVDLPVGPRTPSIGHLVAWEHSEEWHVPKPQNFILQSSIPMSPTSKLYVTKNIKIDPQSTDILFEQIAFSDYKLDTSIVIPPSYFLLVVWRLFAETKGKYITEVPIMINSVIFSKIVSVHDGPVDLLVTLSTVTGHFEVILNSSELVSQGDISLDERGNSNDETNGNITSSSYASANEEMNSPSSGYTSGCTRDDIYKELSLRGCTLGGNFRVLHELFIDSQTDLESALYGKISLPISSPLPSKEATLMCLIDGLFQLSLLQSNEKLRYRRGYYNMMAGFTRLSVDPKTVLSCLCAPSDRLSIACSFDSEPQTHTCCTDGAALEEVHFIKHPRNALQPEPRIENYSFQPYFQDISEQEKGLDQRFSLATMMEIVFENTASRKVNILQVVQGDGVVDSKLVERLSTVSSGCSVKNVHHDLLVVGQDLQSQIKSLEDKVTGNFIHIESATIKSMQNISLCYDVIITSSLVSVQCLLDCKKLTIGGFVLLAMKATDLEEENGLVTDLPSSQTLTPTLVAERYYNVTTDPEKSDSHSPATNDTKIQSILLKLYRLCEANTQRERSTAIVHISAKSSFSWISKLKKLLTAKDGPQRIYCVAELQRAYPTGLIGMVNCLRLEGYASRLRCIQLDDVKWEEFLNDHTHVWEHIKDADMIMNVVRRGQVGSYVHTPLPSPSLDNKELFSLEESAFSCSPNKTYVITGGLGGFGLELAEWLVERGARFLILTSRTGMLTPYRRRKLQIMEAKGAKACEISTLDVSDEHQAFSLIEMAADFSPNGVGGVFHLAVVLRDCLFENQSVKRFKTVLLPKSTGALNIDRALRKFSLHPSYDTPLFVMFSSATAGLGNAGQTNYAFANSSMERLCELRNAEGLSSLAIQWGAIGEVGILHTIMGGKDVESVAGTKPQPIHSCLACLDTILGDEDQRCSTISCYIPALQVNASNKKTIKVTDDNSSSEATADSKKDVKLSICQVLGIRDPTRLSQDAKLNELGLDSLMNFEVRSLLENDFGLLVASKDLQKMSLRDLVEATSQSTDSPCKTDDISAMESSPNVRLSVVGEVEETVDGGKVEAVSSATSVSTQSSFVNVVENNDE